MTAITEAPVRHKKDRRPELTAEEAVNRRALTLLISWSGRTNAAIASAASDAGLKMSGEKVRQRREGETRIRHGELSAFAAALGVPVECLDMPAEQLIDWALTDNRGRDLLIASSRCIELLAS